MINKDIELKLFIAMAVCFLGFILLRTRSGEKRRPVLLFYFYLIYIAFQCLNRIEFFPLTAFQMYSFPEEKNVQYIKFIAVRNDGTVLNMPPHRVLPMLSDGRIKRYARDAFAAPTFADEFATVFDRAYRKRFGRGEQDGIREVRFEEWKWDFLREPNDPNHGFVMKKIVGHPTLEEGPHA